jgi:molybdate transport system substrate-binding protein
MAWTLTRFYRLALIILGMTKLAIAFGGSALAVDIKVLSGGAVKAGLSEAAATFETQHSDKIIADYAPMGLLAKKLTQGATPDIVIVTSDVIDSVRAKGWIVPGTEVEVGRVAIGVAVPENAALPDISTPGAIKALLLRANGIAMINPETGTSGRHLAQVFERLGIADAVKPKLKLMDQGFAVEPVGRGEADVGLHQITEILPVKGVKLVGPLPAELQKVTVYIGAVGANAAHAEVAKSLLAYLRSPPARAAFERKGYMPD